MHKSEVYLAVGTHVLMTGVRETVRTTVRPEAGLPDLTLLHTCCLVPGLPEEATRLSQIYRLPSQQKAKNLQRALLSALSAEAAGRKHREEYPIDKSFIYALCG